VDDSNAKDTSEAFCEGLVNGGPVGGKRIWRETSFFC
jgi:hypothetical protein